MKISFFLSLPVLTSICLSAHANPYAPEINAIRDRERVMIEQMNRKMIAILKVESQMAAITSQLSNLRSAIPDEQAESLGERATTSKLLARAASDLASTGVAFQELDRLEGVYQDVAPELLRLLESEDLPKNPASEKDTPSARIKDQLAKIQAALPTIRRSLTARKQLAEQEIENWITASKVALLRRQVSEDEVLRTRLEFNKSLYSTNLLFTDAKVEIEARLLRKDFEGAAELAVGHTWLMGMLDLLYGATADEPAKRHRLKLLQEHLKEQDEEIWQQVRSKKPPEFKSTKWLRLLELIPRSFAEERFGNDPQLKLPGLNSIPTNEPDGTEVGQTRIYSDLKAVYIDGDPRDPPKAIAATHPKKDRPRHPKSAPKETPSDDGFEDFVQLHGHDIIDREPLIKITDLPDKIDHEIEKQAQAVFQKDPPRPLEQPLKDQIEHLDKMIENAQAKSGESDRAGLDQLRREAQRWEGLRSFYDQQYHQSLSNLFNSIGSNQEAINLATSDRLAIFRKLVPLTQAEQQELADAESNALRGIVDLATMVPLAGDPATLANSIYAMATGKDLLGRKVSMTVVTLQGAAAILGLSTGTKIAGKIGAAISQAGIISFQAASRLTKGTPVALQARQKYLGTVGKFGSKYAGQLPPLDAKYIGGFAKPAVQKIMKPGTILWMAMDSSAAGKGKTMGRWFTKMPLLNAEQAKLALYLHPSVSSNDAQVIKMFVVKEEINGFYGAIKNGVGNQFFVPRSAIPDSELVNLFEELRW